MLRAVAKSDAKAASKSARMPEPGGMVSMLILRVSWAASAALCAATQGVVGSSSPGCKSGRPRGRVAYNDAADGDDDMPNVNSTQLMKVDECLDKLLQL